MILRGNRNLFDGLQYTTDDGLSACFLDNAVIFVHSRKEGALRGLMASQGVVLKKKQEYKLKLNVEMFCN